MLDFSVASPATCTLVEPCITNDTTENQLVVELDSGGISVNDTGHQESDAGAYSCTFHKYIVL